MTRIVLALLAVAAMTAPAFAQNAVVRYGSLRIPTVPLVGIEKGFFKEQGINVETVFFKSGAEIAPAVATGQVQVAATTSGAPLFNALTRGISLKIVADALTLEPGSPGGDPTAIVVRSALVKSGDVKGAKDLAGRKIAVTAPGQILDMIARQYMDNAGISADKYTIIAMPMPDMLVALETGAIDAAVMLDPFPSMAEQKGIGTRMASGSKELPGLQQAFMIYSPELTEKNRDLGQRFMDAYEKTNSWMRKAVLTPEGRKEIAEIYQKLLPAQSAKAYEDVSLSTATADLAINVTGKFGVNWQVETLKQRGLLQGAPVVADYVDTGFIKKFEGRK